MFFLLLFVFLFIVNCGGRAKYQVVVEQKLEELKVIDYFPRGESVPVFIQYIKVSFSSQVTFNFEIEPPVSGELIYDSSSASIIFKPLFTLEYGKSYRVKVKAKDIFSESSTEVLWEFTTIPQDLSPYSVFVPKCFKDKVLVEVSFPYTSSVYIYSNSVRVKDTVASAGRWGFEISENLKEGQNVIEVEVLPLISGERILFRQSSIKDTIPPDPP
ncbi:MAG: Ig-like domain-containing protein, partial [Candidatus Pacearchaeota archaeon]